MTALEAYILARAYAKALVEGAGALKGAPCQIQSITPITGGNRITFAWENSEGETETDTLDVMDGVDGTNGTDGTDGTDGVGISSITYKEEDQDGNYVYTVLLTNSSSYDITCPKGPQGSTGQTGATGNGIVIIEKTSTVGLVDTYTITYTNGTTSNFTVTNGQNGVSEFLGTSVEWGQLSTAEKMEYDTFQFTDDYNDANYIYLPTIYSEEERQVGVYVDGKPLYQKTLLSVNTDDVLATNVDALVDFRVKRHGVSPNSNYIDVGDGYQVNDFVCAKLIDHTLTYQNWSSTPGAIEKTADIVTIRYTKTTDTAGSGTWTPTGQYAEHYSTDEQIIGTWIDGKTLYRKVYSNIQMTNSTDVTVDAEFGSAKTITSFKAIADGTVGNVRYQTPITNYSHANNDFSNPHVVGDALKLVIAGNWSAYTATVIVEYTKAS